MEGDLAPIAARLLAGLSSYEQKSFENRRAKLFRRPVNELRTFAARRAPAVFGGRVKARIFSGDVMDVVLPEIVGIDLYRYGYFEAELTRVVITHLRPGMVVLDVGAQYGYYSVLSSQLVGAQGSVHAFEPTPRTYQILKSNTDRLGNVLCVNAAVFSAPGTLRIRDFGPRFSALNTLLADARLPKALRGKMEATEHEVRCVRLDDYCEAAGIHPDFVKVDAESVELQVLEGMERLLIAGIPMLSVETGDYEVEGSAASWECIRYLGGLGYTCLEYKAGKLAPHQRRERYDYDNLYFVKAGRFPERIATVQYGPQVRVPDLVDSTQASIFPLGAATDRDDAGGKARGLARLVALGHRVPAGFVISKWARHTNTGGSIDPVFAEQLLSAYRRLGAEAVALRSSAEEEDSELSSQAGIHASHLNVIGEAALLVCVETMWAEAAKAGELMAIIVQVMLEPVAAGVLFTRSPESPDHCLIESAWGLGVAVISGAPCDAISVGRTDHQVTLQVAQKHTAVVAAPGGGTRIEPCIPELVCAPSLSTDVALELASLAMQVEADLGRPLDIEWAVVGDTVHLLQARPLAEPDTWLSPRRVGPDDRWSLVNMAELFPDPVTPFTWSLANRHWTELIEESLNLGGVSERERFDFFQLFDQRVYLNVGAAFRLRSHLTGRGWQPALTFNEGPDRIGLQPGKMHLPTIALNLPHLLNASLRGAWRRRGARTKFEGAEQTASRYRQVALECTEAMDLWQLHKEVWSEITRLQLIEMAVDNSVFAANGRLESLSRRWLGDASLVKRVLPGEMTTPAAIALELADLVAKLPDEAGKLLLTESGADLAALRQIAPEWCDELDAFLARHGHRARGELEWAQPRWVEDPTPVLDVIRGCVTSDRPLHRAQSGDSADWELDARLRIRNHQAARLMPWRGILFRAALRRARLLLPMRSLPRDRVMMLYLAGRLALRKLARTLIERGLLETEEELFYLTVEEIDALLMKGAERGTHQRIKQRMVSRMKAAARPAQLLRDAAGHPIHEPEGDRNEAGELRGRGVVPGIVEGPVRLLLGPSDLSRVRLGDVLVMPLTDIGLVLLFPMAAAMVVEQGGLLSHASVLAREYRIPTVIQVPEATLKLADGEIVRVDGESGLVRRLRPGAPGGRAAAAPELGRRG